MSLFSCIGAGLGIVGSIVGSAKKKKAAKAAAKEAEKQRAFMREMAQKEATAEREERKTHLIMAGVGGVAIITMLLFKQRGLF